ncbi:MAG: hypothetical protein AAF763_05090 [Pseudomonadota bacterium]
MTHLKRPRGIARLAAILGAAALAALTPPAGPAKAVEFAVAPGRVFVDFSSGRGQGRLEVTNRSGSDMALSIGVADFALDADNRVVRTRTTAASFSNWLVVNPSALDVPSGETRTVRFAVRPLAEPRTGEYKAMITFDQADAGRIENGAVSFGVSLGVPIYATYGAVERTATLHGVSSAGGALIFDVSSTGTAHARLSGFWAAFSAGGYPSDARLREAMAASDPQAALAGLGARASGRLPSTAVFPGERRRLSTGQGAGGSGVVFVHGTLGDAPIERRLQY